MIPKYLYHYSSIEKLGNIIEHGTIRFTRLDVLNDPLEGLLDDMEDTVFKMLVYRGRNAVEEINNVYSPIKVIYMERSKLSVHTSADDYIFLTELGLRKAYEWNFESEWRFKLMLRKQIPKQVSELETQEYIDIPFNIGNIVEILTSPNMKDSDIDMIKGILAKREIEPQITGSYLRFRAKKY